MSFSSNINRNKRVRLLALLADTKTAFYAWQVLQPIRYIYIYIYIRVLQEIPSLNLMMHTLQIVYLDHQVFIIKFSCNLEMV